VAVGGVAVGDLDGVFVGDEVFGGAVGAAVGGFGVLH